MAQLLRTDSAGLRRMGVHAAALASVVAITIASGVFAGPAPVAELQVASEENPDPEQAQPAQFALPVGEGPSPLAASVLAQPTAQVRTQGADQGSDQVASLSFNPRSGLPQWLRTVRDTPLWSGPDPSATTFAVLSAGNGFVKPLGQFADTRVQVYFPGDDRTPAAQAWVDTANVEPSTVPGWIAPSTTVGLTSGLAAAPKRVGDDPAPNTSAVHIAIIDDASGQLMYGELPYTEVPQASTTKIATTIVALERSPDLSRRINVTISATAMAAQDGSSTMGIEPGRTVSLDTLLHGMMLPSGNDAAEQVAVALADSREQYVGWMNQEAAALGLKDTHFVNPSGMDAPGHYSSAYDMAMLARYAMHNAEFHDLASTSQYTSDGFSMQNLNRLMGVYPGVDGVKIGYTDAAAKTIVASATHDGHHVYISLMHSQDLVGDCSALFDWVWDNFDWQ
jgi:D-alanyl-D-alanine carboxypeptidase